MQVLTPAQQNFTDWTTPRAWRSFFFHRIYLCIWPLWTRVAEESHLSTPQKYLQHHAGGPNMRSQYCWVTRQVGDTENLLQFKKRKIPHG